MASVVIYARVSTERRPRHRLPRSAFAGSTQNASGYTRAPGLRGPRQRRQLSRPQGMAHDAGRPETLAPEDTSQSGILAYAFDRADPLACLTTSTSLEQLKTLDVALVATADGTLGETRRRLATRTANLWPGFLARLRAARAQNHHPQDPRRHRQRPGQGRPVRAPTSGD